MLNTLLKRKISIESFHNPDSPLQEYANVGDLEYHAAEGSWVSEFSPLIHKILALFSTTPIVAAL